MTEWNAGLSDTPAINAREAQPGKPLARRRMVFIDRGVEDGETLRRGVKPGVEVAWLAADRAALAQIADRLADGPPVEHLYIVSHGRPGALCLSGGVVDGAALLEQANSLSRIAAALAPGAALALLACEVGKDRSGRAFVQAFGRAVDAEVSAPEHIVGSPAFGGSWRIRGVGDLPFGSDALDRFSGSLAAVYDGSTGNDTISGTAGDDTIDATTTDGTTPADSDNDTVNSGDGNDTVTAGSGNDSVNGGAGNDLITGGAGNDLMSGGDGTDLIYGGLGNDSIAGLAGNDTVYGDGGNDFLLGDGLSTNGNDVIYGGAGNDTVWGDHSGGTGDDTVFGEAGDDQISGDAGNDLLYGGADRDTLLGGTGNDTLSGGNGNDRLSGGAGDDVLIGGGATEVDTLIGGDGNDTFTGAASDHNLDTITDFAIGDTIVVTGTDLSSLSGTAASDTIDLGGGFSLALTDIDSTDGYFAAVYSGGNTTITLTTSAGGGGGGGGDSGGGSDSSPVTVSDNNGDTTGGSRTVTNSGGSSASAAIVQNTGNNNNVVTATLPPSVQITSDGPSTAQSGTTASDTLINAIDVRDTPGESESIGNAQGFLDTLSPTTALDVRTIVPTVNPGITTDDPIVITGSANGTQIEAFVIDMRTITGKTLQVNNIEFVSVMGNATVTGGAGNNYAVGDDNAQFISLGTGDDTLYGGGSDTVGSADGNDKLYGEAGTDSVIGGAGNDTIFGGTEADVAYGNLDADVLYGNQANDTLFGGQSSDTAFGGQNDDVAYGNLGDDVLYGNLGDDTLYGGQGNDALFGGESGTVRDVLIGGLGDDTLNGGQGADSLSGGEGIDLFVIDSSGGADTIGDFDGGGDRVQIAANANGTSIDTFAELVAAAADTSDGGVEFALGSGNTVKLMGVTTAQLQAGWFVFT